MGGSGLNSFCWGKRAPGGGSAKGGEKKVVPGGGLAMVGQKDFDRIVCRLGLSIVGAGGAQWGTDSLDVLRAF